MPGVFFFKDEHIRSLQILRRVIIGWLLSMALSAVLPLVIYYRGLSSYSYQLTHLFYDFIMHPYCCRLVVMVFIPDALLFLRPQGTRHGRRILFQPPVAAMAARM